MRQQRSALLANFRVMACTCGVNFQAAADRFQLSFQFTIQRYERLHFSSKHSSRAAFISTERRTAATPELPSRRNSVQRKHLNSDMWKEHRWLRSSARQIKKATISSPS